MFVDLFERAFVNRTVKNEYDRLSRYGTIARPPKIN